MNATRLLCMMLSLLTAACLLACSDHQLSSISPGSTSSRLRVRTLTVETPNTPAKVSLFSYDGQGRLASVLGYQFPDSSVAPVENTVYQYDAQNRLTQVQRTVVRRGSNSETYTFTYNATGQVATLSHSPSTFLITPTYGPTGQASGYSKTIGVAGLQAYGGGSFTFTGNDLTLATEQLSVIRSGGPAVPVFSRSTSTTFTFDDKVNPFYGVFVIPAPGVFGPMPVSGSFGPYYTLYGGIDNAFNLSQNNVLSAGSTTYAYTYNAQNLPLTRTNTVSSAVTETLRYEYEPY